MQVLLERLNVHVLPFVLDLKAKVDRGERLDDVELRLLEALVDDASRNIRLATDHPNCTSGSRLLRFRPNGTPFADHFAVRPDSRRVASCSSSSPGA